MAGNLGQPLEAGQKPTKQQRSLSHNCKEMNSANDRQLARDIRLRPQAHCHLDLSLMRP